MTRGGTGMPNRKNLVGGAWERAFMADLEHLAIVGRTLGIRERAAALLEACKEATYHQVPFGQEATSEAKR